MPLLNDRTAKGLARACGILAAAAAIALIAYAVAGGRRGPSGNPYAYDVPAMDPSRNMQASFAETGGFDPGFGRIMGVAVGGRDEIFVIGDQSLSVFSEKGGLESSTRLPGAPTSLAVLRPSFFSGAEPITEAPVFVSLGDRIMRLDGADLTEWSPLGEGSVITSMAAGPSALIAADAGRKLVWVFDHSGKLKSVTAGKGDGFVVPSPYFDAALDREGGLWIANPGERRVEKYDASFEMVASWGKSSMDIDGFCGCCNPSHFAMDAQGRFYTAEKGIPRIKQYDRQGVFAALVAGSDQFDEGTVGLDLAVDSKGRVLVADPKRKKIRIFSPK